MPPDRGSDYERLRLEIQKVFEFSRLADLSWACETAESKILRHVRLRLVSLLSVPQRRNLWSAENSAGSEFSRNGQIFIIRTADDIIVPRKLSIAIRPISQAEPDASNVVEELAFESAGLYSAVRLILSKSLGSERQRLALLVKVGFETGYHILEQCIGKRLDELEQDVVHDMYTVLRSALGSTLVNEIWLYLILKGKGVYLYDTQSRGVALDRTGRYQTQASLSPLLQLARFASLALPTTELFTLSSRTTEVNILSAPYADTGLHHAEAALVRSGRMMIQRLAGGDLFRIEACYPAMLNSVFKQTLRSQAHVLKAIMERGESHLKGVLHHLDGRSLTRETYALEHHKAWPLPQATRSFVSPLQNTFEEPRKVVSKQYRFQIALSFPGEYRSRVQQIAELLSASVERCAILYDQWYAAEFARPNLDVYLANLYHEESLLLVFFLCSDYTQKEWCGLEWRAGRDLLKQKEDQRLMLLRLDGAKIPGLYSIDGFLDIATASDADVAAAILARAAILKQ